MTAATILTLSNGLGIDLLNPKADDIDFRSIAEHLSKENRYNGATPELIYSVAEHSVRGAMAAQQATGDDQLAAYFLLHDAHEAFLKDDTTPKKRAIGALAFEHFGVLATTITASFDLLTDRIDAAVHEAAGLSWPPTHEMLGKIKHWDLRMFVTEWRDLMNGQQHPNWTPYENIEPLSAPILPFRSWQFARERFGAACRELLPVYRR